MTIKELILLVLAGVLADNLAFEKLFGITDVVGNAGKSGKLWQFGLTTAAVMVVAEAIAWPLGQILPGYLSTLVLVALVLILAWVAEKVMKQKLFALIALNAAVFGALLSLGAAGYGFGASVLAALGMGLGFTLALILMSGVQSRIDEHYVPESFRGLPVSVLAAAIIAMALVAFK